MLHKKIQNLLKSADLPKDLSEDLKKELESHFYEKEYDLSLSGLSSEEIEEIMHQDFGDEKSIGATLQLIHSQSLIKTIMKKLLVPTLITLFILIFMAPWLWIDNGENILESEFFRAPDEQLFNKIKADCECDGSCQQVHWAPFGAKVDACSKDFYYLTFWGQRFYRSND